MTATSTMKALRQQVVSELMSSVDDIIEKHIATMLRNVFGGSTSSSTPVEPKKRKQRASKTCPVSGCKNAFAPRYGGYCLDHRSSAGFKAWSKSKGKPAKAVKPAKKTAKVKAAPAAKPKAAKKAKSKAKAKPIAKIVAKPKAKPAKKIVKAKKTAATAPNGTSATKETQADRNARLESETA